MFIPISPKNPTNIFNSLLVTLNFLIMVLACCHSIADTFYIVL
jgi:hypothetical protein